MSKFMLDEKDSALLTAILSSIPNSVFVYGSRVKGTAQRFSDIDLYIEGYLSDDAFAHLLTQLDESDISIHVDIKKNLSPAFLKSIQADFIRFK